MKFDYVRFIKSDRLEKSSIPNRGLLEEIYSDRSRVLYSSAFRRLQQKAQVFSLESNAAVRSRLTHSLEVSDIGRLISTKITDNLLTNKIIEENLRIPFITLVETSCLLHDLGNPPFGHFGEIAIQKWFSSNWRRLFLKSLNIKGKKDTWSEDESTQYDSMSKLIKDFTEFDGNPQGIRIATILQEPMGKERFVGFNLTKSQILCSLKYVRSPLENKSKKYGSNTKKPGYFISESEQIQRIKDEFEIKKGCRFPLTYIVEAADDIAYCLSDFEDGIEKKIISSKEFFTLLKDEWVKHYQIDMFPFNLYNIIEKNYLIKNGEYNRGFFKFKTTFTRESIELAMNIYCDRNNHRKFFQGSEKSLLELDEHYGHLLNVFKKISRLRLYRSGEAESKEIAGYNIIKGLLNHFESLLTLSENSFEDLLLTLDDPEKNYKKGLDYEWRIFHQLPKKYIESYKQLLKINNSYDSKAWEWFARSHLIVDFLSGMTDKFALDCYLKLTGAKLE